jgi:hypothetical protein
MGVSFVFILALVFMVVLGAAALVFFWRGDD